MHAKPPRSVFIWLSSLILAAMLVAPVLAQDTSEAFTFASGTVFQPPVETDVEAVGDLQATFAASDGPTVIVSDYALFQRAKIAASAALRDAMDWYVEHTTDREISVLPPMTADLTLDERDAVQMTYTDDQNHMGMLVAIRYSNGKFGLIDAYVPRGQQSKLRSIFDLAQSLDSASVEAVDCRISVDSERTAQLRVGPGTNRTAFAFLPAKKDYVPLGQIEADDGSIWFQLDRELAAPQSAAAEAWVAAEAVQTEGNCLALGLSDAPPIVPISNAAPPPANNDGGGQSSGNAVAPSPGTWTITFSNQGRGSCLDDASFTFNFSADWGPQVVNLSFSGSAVVLDGQRLSQVSPGLYRGNFTLSNGNSLQFFLRPVSATYFTGEGMLTGVVEGHTCSNTVPLTATRN